MSQEVVASGGIRVDLSPSHYSSMYFSCPSAETNMGMNVKILSKLGREICRVKPWRWEGCGMCGQDRTVVVGKMSFWWPLPFWPLALNSVSPDLNGTETYRTCYYSHHNSHCEISSSRSTNREAFSRRNGWSKRLYLILFRKYTNWKLHFLTTKKVPQLFHDTAPKYNQSSKVKCVILHKVRPIYHLLSFENYSTRFPFTT